MGSFALVWRQKGSQLIVREVLVFGSVRLASGLFLYMVFGRWFNSWFLRFLSFFKDGFVWC